ncbi:MAG: universal stress protein [Myxococcales bacterium]|nr:universal stress protein [Myxococcales bacterium]
MFGTIIVGLDGSPREALVRRRAVQVADAMGGRLLLVRAVQVPANIPAMVWALGDEEFKRFLVEHARNELQRMADALPEGLAEGVICREGRASEVLCDVARERRANLVVIGTHGFDRVDRLLGTTAARVTNQAPCSVLVVRDAE